MIGTSPTKAAAAISDVPAVTPSGTSAVTANWVTTLRAAASNAAVNAPASVAVTTLPLPALAKAASWAVCLPVPSETASSTTPDFFSAFAAFLAEVVLPSSWPSERSTALRLPSAPSCSTVSPTASLSAVAPLASSPSMPFCTLARSVVGATVTCASSANVMRPALTSAGKVFKYCLAASWALPSLPNSAIDPLESSTIIVVRGTAGPASAPTGVAVVGASIPSSVVRTLAGSIDSPSAKPSADRTYVTTPAADSTCWMRPSGAAQAMPVPRHRVAAAVATAARLIVRPPMIRSCRTRTRMFPRAHRSARAWTGTSAAGPWTPGAPGGAPRRRSPRYSRIGRCPAW